MADCTLSIPVEPSASSHNSQPQRATLQAPQTLLLISVETEWSCADRRCQRVPGERTGPISCGSNMELRLNFCGVRFSVQESVGNLTSHCRYKEVIWLPLTAHSTPSFTYSSGPHTIGSNGSGSHYVCFIYHLILNNV